MMAAAVKTPDQPLGANGRQFAGLTYAAPNQMKNVMMASLSTTIEELNQALSRMPTTSTTVTSMTIRKAGRLNTRASPPRWGAAASAWALLTTASPKVAGSIPLACAAATWSTA